MSRIENRSGLRPLGRAVLVTPYSPETKKSVIVLTQSSEERDATINQRAIVVEVGPECWPDEKAPRARPGDKVLIAKFAGHVARGPLDDQLYRVINDRDIFTQITGEAE